MKIHRCHRCKEVAEAPHYTGVVSLSYVCPNCCVTLLPEESKINEIPEWMTIYTIKKRKPAK